MATGVGMSFDLDAALRNAEKLDKKLSDMVATASKLEQTMTNAFRAGGATEILSRLQQRLSDIGNKKVDVHFETKKAEELYGIMDRIVSAITTLSQGGQVELFDTKKVYETADSMLQVERNLEQTKQKIADIRAEWRKAFVSHELDNFQAPINPKTGKAYTKSSEAYRQAREQALAEAQAAAQKRVDTELRALIETEAIQKKELQWVSMTEDQKAQYVQKRLDDVLKAEQKHTSEVRREYSKLSSEIIRIYDQIQRTEQSVAKGEKTGVDVSKEKGQLTTLESQLREKLARQQEIEQESGNLILQQIKDFWVKVQEHDRKGLDGRIKAQQEKYNTWRQEYVRITSEIVSITDKIAKAEKSIKRGEEAGVDVTLEKENLASLETLLTEHTQRREALERAMGNRLFRERQAFWLKQTELDRKGLEDSIAAAKQAEAEYRRTPMGALDLAQKARTGEEKRAAKDYIKEALYKVDQDDVDTIEKLNAAYIRMTADLEKLTRAQENEQTIQPKLRNEYARLLKELDNLAAAKKKVQETDAFKSGDAQAQKNLSEIVAREQDVQRRIKEIKDNAQGLLDETERKHAAERANNEIAEIERVERKRQEYAKLYTGLSPMQAQSLVTAGQGTQAIANEEKAIQRLVEQKYALDKQDRNYVQTINRLDDEIAEHKRNIQALTEAERERAEQQKKQNQTFAGAIAFSNSAKTLEEERQAVKNLEAAREKLDKTDVDGLNELNSRIKQHKKNIQEATASVEDLQEKHRGLMDTSGQLARAMAAVFSVSAIKGYVNKLMQIRGEFELQQRSLQVLLQNKDEANALWDKTVALAVKSPYTTKQLVTATKQLAAYRVETEKLYETNRMLADVSIGLGVDMNRLILAFGQVKAANFLRGTELRQFSEAGVNLLDELAQRFTMLEGRAVSVGEVFERVSKRMVSFKDVEAVFKNITSAGGIFYQMQEKQSETLKGMMLNLKDSYELMLNDIGKSNEGVLKSFVSFIKLFVDGWREAAVVIKTAGTAMLFYFPASKIAKIGSAFSALWAAMAANPIGIIAAGVAALITLAVSLYQHTNKLNDALREVEKNVTESLEESIGLYRKLTDTINDSTASLDERNEAYENLKTKFKDILPDQQLELEYIQGLSFSYKKAEDAMFAYYNAKAIQQKKDKVESLYESDFSTDTGDLVKGLKQRIEDSDKFTEEQKIKLKSGVLGAVNAVVDDLKSGDIAASIDTVKGELEKRLLDFSGVQIDIFEKDWWGEGSAISKVMKNVGELVENARGFKDAMKEISGLAYKTFAQEEASKAMEAQNKEIETAVSLYKHLVLLRQKLADNKVDLTSDKNTLNPKQLKDREWYLEDLQYTFSEIDKLAPDVANGIKEIDKSLVSAAEKGAYEFAKSLGTAENALYNIFADKAKTLTSDDRGAQAMLTNFAENIKATADSKLATPLQKALISAFDKAINDRNLSQKGKDLLTTLIPDEKDSTSDVRDKVEAIIKAYETEVERWSNATAVGATKLPLVEYINQWGEKKFKSAMGMYLGSDEEFNELRQKVIPVLEHINRLLGGDLSKDKKGRSRDLVDERLRVIKEIYEAYKELNKTFDETTSKTGAMEKFGDAFYSAFGKTPEEMGYNLFTAEGVVDAYNKFISTLSKADDITKGNLAKGEFVMELQVEMQQKNDKAFQDQIEQMFSGYELSLELEKLNIPRDVAERLFGVDTFDLSEIRQKLEDELYNLQVAGGGQDQINALQKYLDRVVDMEKKAQVEMLKNYSKYLVQAQSERVKILLEQQKMLEDIASLPIGEEDKALMREGVEKEIQKKLQQQAWKDFQDSGMYLRLFENLEGASMQSLDTMEAKLEELRDSLTELDPTELKEINNQLEKIQELKVEKNPFKELGKDAKTFFEYLKNKKDWAKNLADSEAKEETLKKTIDAEQLAIKDDELQLAILQSLNGEHDAIVNTMDEELKVRKANLKVLLDALEAQGKITKAERKKLESGEDAKKSLKNRFSEAAEYATGIASSLGDMTESLESVFGMSDGLKDTIQVIQGVGMGLGDMLSGAAGLMSGNPLQMIQGGMQAVSGFAKIIGSFNEAYDKKKERQIQAEIKLVERLNKLYDQLGKQIEKAYSIDTFEAANKNAKANLEEQIRATERMIDAERDKKKTDWERIKEFNEQIQENLERLKELEQQRLQGRGSIGGEDYYKDNAQTFVDAWLDGFLEIGDGLINLEDEFDTLIMNIAKKQLMLKATDKFLAPLYSAIDEAVRDTDVTRQEMEEIEQKAKDALPQLNTFLKGLMEQMGMGDLAGSKSELGSLGAGIQGISESQADTIAAYLNSLRFYVADNNTQLKALVAAQGLDTDAPNPMLSQLLVIAEQTRAIHELFDSVVVGGHKMGRNGIKVFID